MTNASEENTDSTITAEREISDATESSEAPAKSRWLWLAQFRLSTFLALITVIMVGGAWWYGKAPLHATLPDGATVHSRAPQRSPADDSTALDGPYTLLDPNGRVLVRGRHVLGVAHGSWRSYHATSGRLQSSGRMENDVAVGVWRYWHPNGQLRSTVTYRRSDQSGPELMSVTPKRRPKWRDGPAETLRQDGTPLSKGVYVANERHGMWEFWDDNARLLEAGDYWKGKRVGIWKEYSSGEEREAFYINHVRHSDVKLAQQDLKMHRDQMKRGELGWRASVDLIRSYGPSARESLIDVLDSPYAAVQTEALAMLAELGPLAGPAEAKAEKLLESPSRRVRLTAASMIFSSNPKRQAEMIRLVAANYQQRLTEEARFLRPIAENARASALIEAVDAARADGEFRTDVLISLLLNNASPTGEWHDLPPAVDELLGRFTEAAEVTPAN